MSKIQVPTKEYIDNLSCPSAIICGVNTYSVTIDFYRTGKFAAMVIWTYNTDICIYGLTINNGGSADNSSVVLHTVFKGSGSVNRTVKASVNKVDNTKTSITLTTNMCYWDVATVIAPCKTSGHAHN